jgi:BirA family biotin operon repressor/biotin-[acetyl-CoA-carboxylase] ligase
VPQPFRSVILEEAGSTNTEAFKRAAAGEPGPMWIMARRQTQGRGRSGRHWTSAPGNLYASLLQRLACPQAVVHQLSLLAGVAVIEAIVAAAGTPVAGLRLKWPNDVLIGEAKCAGILPESHSSGRAAEVVVVIGIGINLASHPEGLGRAATHLAEHGVAVTPGAMLAQLAGAVQRWLGLWDGGRNFSQVRAAWLAHGGRPGESLTVDTGRERIAGTFLDLDASGALLMRDTQGQQRKLTFGDVTLAPPAPRGGS